MESSEHKPGNTLRRWAEHYRVAPSEADRARIWRNVRRQLGTAARPSKWKQWVAAGALLAGLAGVVVVGVHRQPDPAVPSSPHSPSLPTLADTADTASPSVPETPPPVAPPPRETSSSPSKQHPEPAPTVPLRQAPQAETTVSPRPVRRPLQSVGFLRSDTVVICEGPFRVEWPPEIGTPHTWLLNNHPLPPPSTAGGRRISLPPGQHHLTVVGSGGRFEQHIEVWPRPDAAFEIGDDGMPVAVEDSALEVQWWLDGRRIDQPVALANATGHRLMRVVTNRWGCSDTAVRYVEGPPVLRVLIPNIIIPDGDGANDRWAPQWEGPRPYAVILEIWNADGRRIFAAQGMETAWDGTCDGQPCPPGYYAYVVKYRPSADAPWQVRRGTVMLRR